MGLNKSTYKWYAVYTRVNQEKKIRSKLDEQNIECYLPLFKTLKQWSQRKKLVEEPLFRCYIFVKVSYQEYFKVLDTSGVVNYVCFEGKPKSIPEYQIENIRKLISQDERDVILTRKRVSKGTKAEVIFGQLKGLQGEVVRICGQSRILIRIEAMNCSLYAKIAKDEIRVLKTIKEKSGKSRKTPKKSLEVSKPYNQIPIRNKYEQVRINT